MIPYEKKGPVPLTQPMFTGHTSNVLDFDFNPFHDHVIASGAEDTAIKVGGRVMCVWVGGWLCVCLCINPSHHPHTLTISAGVGHPRGRADAERLGAAGGSAGARAQGE